MQAILYNMVHPCVHPCIHYLSSCSGYEVQFHLLDNIPMGDNDLPLIPEEKYKPFKLPSIQEAEKSSSPTSFGLRTQFHSPLPREITINGNLLHGALKRSSSYAVVIVTFYEDAVGIIL